jgi:hypothetical protein
MDSSFEGAQPLLRTCATLFRRKSHDTKRQPVEKLPGYTRADALTVDASRQFNALPERIDQPVNRSADRCQVHLVCTSDIGLFKKQGIGIDVHEFVHTFGAFTGRRFGRNLDIDRLLYYVSSKKRKLCSRQPARSIRRRPERQYQGVIMSATLTLKRAIINGRLWWCALLLVYAMTAANVYWLGSTITKDGALKKAVFAVKPKQTFTSRVHIAQTSLTKTAKSDEAHRTAAVLAVCLIICFYMRLHVSVPAAVRYRLVTYLKRFFANLSKKRRTEALKDTQLGDLLVACKVLTAEQLKEMLEAGEAIDEKNFEMVAKLGSINDSHFESALVIQAKLQKRACRQEKTKAWLSMGNGMGRDEERASLVGGINRLRHAR